MISHQILEYGYQAEGIFEKFRLKIFGEIFKKLKELKKIK